MINEDVGDVSIGTSVFAKEIKTEDEKTEENAATVEYETSAGMEKIPTIEERTSDDVPTEIETIVSKGLRIFQMKLRSL